MLATLVLAVAFAGQGPAAKEPAILELYENYDRITGKGKTGIDLGPLVADSPWKLSLDLVTTYQGESRPEKPRVGLLFASAWKDWRYLNNRDLFILADGVRVGTTTKHDGKVVDRGVVELVLAEISFEDFGKVATARVIEAKLGSTTFTFTPDQQVALRAYHALLASPGKSLEQIRADIAEKEAAEKAKRRADQTPAAEKMLAEAKTLDRANKAAKATELYRTIVRQYPDTAAAKQAADRLRVMAKQKKR